MATAVEKHRKLQALKQAIGEGMADVEAGRVVPWDLEELLKQTVVREAGQRLARLGGTEPQAKAPPRRWSRPK